MSSKYELYYLKDCDVISSIGKKRVFVYGAGAEGKQFFTKYSSCLHIEAFIDNYMTKKEMYGIKVLPLNKIDHIGHDEFVIICSDEHAFPMKESLESIGYKPGKDFYVWDRDYNSKTERVIEFNRSLWDESELYSDSDSEVIIELNNFKSSDTAAIVYGYVSDYLRKRYKSKVKIRVMRDGTSSRIMPKPSVLEVYSSFGVDRVIEVKYDSYRDEIDNLYESAKKGIHSLEDWNDIVVDGVNYGDGVISHYLRTCRLSFDFDSQYFLQALYDSICEIVFWKYYLDNHDVRCVVYIDAVNFDSIMRKAVASREIDSYVVEALSCGAYKVGLDAKKNVLQYEHYKDFFNMLSEEEKEKGISWAKNELDNVFAGDSTTAEYTAFRLVSSYGKGEKGSLRLNNQKNKPSVLICPHVFDEDPLANGEQLFDNNMLEWLWELGRLSLETDYNWYIKKHPDEVARGNVLIDKVCELFPEIRALPTNIVSDDIKESGIDYALTIAGSVGHEYPLLGINVINAGSNPHMSFQFNINPSSKEEYIDVIRNIEKYDCLDYVDQVFEYFCVDYYFLKRNHRKLNEEYYLDEWVFDKPDSSGWYVDHLAFINHHSPERHKTIIENTVKLFADMDSYDSTCFYRRH